MAEAAVAIDIGGTKTAAALVAADGSIRARRAFATPPREDGAGLLTALAEAVAALSGTTGASAIGISICELVDNDGRVTSAHRVAWPAGRPAIAPPYVAITVEADIRAAAVAESRLGAGRGFRQMLYVNLGTGISSCLVLDGVPHRGARGNALVIGSGPIEAHCTHCGKRTSHVVEDLAGAAALVEAYRREGADAGSASDVFEAAASGDERARAVLDQAVLALGSAIGNAINILDPEVLVLGGGLALAGGAYATPLEASIREHVWSPGMRDLPILRAALGADSALIGAGLVALDRAGSDGQATASSKRL